MKRYLESNLLTGYLPSFLSTEPTFDAFNVADNEFYCPLPTWCDSYTGNGECAPCVPSPSSSLSLSPSLSITSSLSTSHSLSASISHSISPSQSK